MRKKEKLLVLLAMVVIGICMSVDVYALPAIDISGLDGAQHWVWVEAEYYDATETTLGGAKAASSNEVSNSNFHSHRNCWGATRYQAGVVNYNIHMPTAMDSSTRIYLKYGAASDSYGKRTGKVDLDTIEVASLTLGYAGNAYGLPPQAWVDAGVGSISAGDHELNLARDSKMWQTFDGFYLVEGEATVGSTRIKSTPFDGGTTNRYLMQAPSSVDAYEIDADGIAPTINVSADAASYECYLNGEAYTPGTIISMPGDYVLEVYAWDTVNNVYSHSGANFTLVPEPATMTLLSLGGVFLLKRRKK